MDRRKINAFFDEKTICLYQAYIQINSNKPIYIAVILNNYLEESDLYWNKELNYIMMILGKIKQ